MKQSALGYHRFSGYVRGQLKGGPLDWSNQPRAYKTYEGIEAIPLPREIQFSETPLDRLYQNHQYPFPGESPTIDSLSSLLFLACGLTAQRRGLGEDFFFRSVPSAGALYPSEIYLRARMVEGLPPGLYHVDVVRHALTPLRLKYFDPDITPKDPKKDLINDTGADFWISGIFFRSSWKYRERAYRYVLLDAGHVIENLCLALGLYRFPSIVFLDFDDESALVLMGFDPLKEVCLAQIRLSGSIPPDWSRLPALASLGSDVSAASRVSEREQLFPEIIEAHKSGFAVKSKNGDFDSMRNLLGLRILHWTPLPDLENLNQSPAFSECVLRRRSHRNFISKQMPGGTFARLINLVTLALVNHRTKPSCEQVLTCGFLIRSVEGLDPGFYILDAGGRSMGLVQAGAFARPMASTCLDQEWLGQAAIHFLFLTNLATIDGNWGTRGYRYAMIAAGRVGQAIYLGCTSLELGACGIGAFYDTEARDLLGLGPDTALLYLVAAGVVRKRFETYVAGSPSKSRVLKIS